MELKTKLSIAFILVTSLLVTTTVDAKVFRWVDENGEVHYSESLPPNFKDEGHDVLNERGITLDEDLSLTPPPAPVVTEETKEEELSELPRDSSGLPRPKPLYSEAEVQQRMDRLLILRYESTEDIDKQRDFEIQQVASDKKMLENSQSSMLRSYRGQIKDAADLQRAGQQVDEATTDSMTILRRRMRRNQTEIEGLAVREAKVRSDFQKQLERYRYLEETWSEDSAGS